MDYLEFDFQVLPTNSAANEIIIAQLAELGFESFMDHSNGFSAYIKSTNLPITINDELNNLIIPEGTDVKWESRKIENQNWNLLWESNFEPIIVDNRCLVKASFHRISDNYDFEIIIDPKMAFGTGHHQTTHLMISALLNEEVENKTVLDMGCGTGVLAILAEMKGAKKVTAIDIDEWAFQNAIENCRTNGCQKVEVLLGDASKIEDLHFDIILANINLNVLLADMEMYYRSLNPSGRIFFSGILKNDVEQLAAMCHQTGFKHIETQYRNDWTMLSFSK